MIAYSIGVFGTMTYLTHRDGQEALRFYREHKKKGSSVPGLISTMRSENEAILYGMEWIVFFFRFLGWNGHMHELLKQLHQKMINVKNIYL